MARATRIAIGSLMHESNTFVTTRTGLDGFAAHVLLRDEAIFSGYGESRDEVPAFIDVLRDAGIDPIPTIAANALAGGPVDRATFRQLLDDLLERLRASLPLDGVLLALHGAMTTEDHADAESVILAAVRGVVGRETRIATSLDLHGHITPQMLEHVDLLVGYQAYPHTDRYETGVKTARLLLDTLDGRLRPALAMAKRPMIVSPVRARTTEPPLSHILDAARAMERSGRIVHASLFPVQPWLDVPDLGFAVLAVGNGDAAAAQAAADELAEMAWQARHEFEPELTPLDEAIRLALEAPEGVTVVGDAGDAPTGGTPADHAGVLRALLAYGAERAARLTYLAICDEEAARAAIDAGVGSAITVPVGHRVSSADGEPVTITGIVRAVSDGRYVARSSGTHAQMGPTAVIAIGSLRLCVRSLPATEWDPGMYESLGLNVRDAALVFVKSPSHFRAAFEPLADRLLVADTPGATCPNMRTLAFRHVTRPLFPLDDI